MTLRRTTAVLASLVTSLAASLLSSTAVMAQTTLLEEVHTASTGATPIEKSFKISNAGAYHLRLTDLNLGQADATFTPQPLASAKIAITAGTTVLGTATLAAGVANVDFNAPANADVVVRVVAKLAGPDKTGNINVDVTNKADSSLVNNFLAALDPAPTELPSYRRLVTESITPGVGSYSVEVEDLALPATLPVLTAIVSESGGSVPLGTINVPAGQATASFTASSATQAYSINLGAESDQAVNAGLYALRVRNSSTGTLVFSRVYTLGTVTQIGTVNLEAGAHTLTFTDFQFPAALVRGGAALTANGKGVVKTTASAVTFTAAAETHQVYATGTAAAGNSGSYGVDVRVQGGASKFSTVKAAGGTSANGVFAYNFIADVATAGSYRLRLADFNFPGTLAAVSLVAAQGGAKLDSLTGAGSLTLPNVAAGQLNIIVLAKAAVAGGGLIGIDLAPSAGGAAVYETSQGVGNLSESRKVSAPAVGNYRVNVTDLEFPAAFTQFSAIVTRGADTSVAIFGSDQFDFAGTPGNYLVNFIAQPNAAEGAGTYGLKVTQLPAAPVVTLSANPSEPTVGSTVRIEWSATNAKTCTASGGWSGAKATSGGENSSPITATATFTLKCDGDGGSTTQSVSVSAVTQSNSGGGGGALGLLTLAGLALAGGTRLSRRSSLI